jgi:glycosyltransferase involved in cell wall biosynthesis
MENKSNPLKVVHVSYSSSGGAGLAAKALVNAQVSIGIDAEFWSVSDGNLRNRPFAHPLVSGAALVDKYLVASGGKNLFTLYRSSIGLIDSILELPSETIVHLHWLPGAVSNQQLEKIAIKFKRVFWTMHDYRAVTGGCHFPGSCTRYRKNCEECPLARSLFWNKIQVNQTALTHSFSKGNLTLICPSEGLRAAVSKSTLGRISSVVMVPNVLPNPGGAKDSGFLIEDGKALKPNNFLFAAAQIEEPRKGLSRVLDWWNSSPRSIGAELWLAGEGSEAYSDPSAQVFGLGRLSGEALAERMALSSFLLFGSTEDNAPGVIQEAIASGMVVVCTDASMMQWLSRDGVVCVSILDVDWNNLHQFYVSSHSLADKKNSEFVSERSPETVARAHAALYSAAG